MKNKAIVVGGGISGISCAIEISKHFDEVVVITPEIGGLLTNHVINDVSFDISGGHVYSSGNPDVIKIMKSIESEWHDRRAYYLHKNNGNEPDEVDFDVRKDFRVVRSGLSNATHTAITYPIQDSAHAIGIMPTSNDFQNYRNGMSLEELSLASFGSDFYEKLFRPFNTRVWTVSPSMLDSDWVATRLKKAEPQNLGEAWGPNARFIYAQGSKILAHLVSKLPSNVRIINDRVLFVNHSKRQVTLYSGSVEFYDALFWSPSLKFIMPQFEELSEDVQSIVSNRVRTVCIAFNKSMHRKFDFTWFYCDVKSPIHRVTLLSKYLKKNAPHGKSTMMLEIPYLYSCHLQSTASDDTKGFQPLGPWMKYRNVTNEFAHRALSLAGLDIDESAIRFAVEYDVPGYPIPTIGIRSTIAKAKNVLRQHDIYPIGRFGSHAYYNIEHCIQEARTLGEFIDSESNKSWHDYAYSTHYYSLYRDGKTPEDYS